MHSGDFEQSPTTPVPPAAAGDIEPVLLTLDLTAPVLDPESVNIVVDRQVQNTIGLTARNIRVYCLVTDDGSVMDARVLRVDPGIPLDSADQSFKASARQSAIDSWRFSPAMRDGEPVPVWFVVTIVYEPRR